MNQENHRSGSTGRWSRIGRNAAYLAGAAFLVGTVLFLLDAADLLGESPEYQVTAAGPIQDDANFWVAYFEHQHGILWDIIGRDLILPVGFLALIVAGLAIPAPRREGTAGGSNS